VIKINEKQGDTFRGWRKDVETERLIRYISPDGNITLDAEHTQLGWEVTLYDIRENRSQVWVTAEESSKYLWDRGTANRYLSEWIAARPSIGIKESSVAPTEVIKMRRIRQLTPDESRSFREFIEKEAMIIKNEADNIQTAGFNVDAQEVVDWGTKIKDVLIDMMIAAGKSREEAWKIIMVR